MILWQLASRGPNDNARGLAYIQHPNHDKLNIDSNESSIHVLNRPCS